MGKVVLEKGYLLHIQPMVTTRYNEEEYRQLIDACNKELPEASAFYIVDSFGQMDASNMTKRLMITDALLSDSMKLGLHVHNNRQMAYANAVVFLNAPVQHDLIIDASIMGMGKGAGNVCTELIAATLQQAGKLYDTADLYTSIHSYFSQQRQKTPWGYSLEYYLSSVYGCTPSYIKIFEKDTRVTPTALVTLLANMPVEKRAMCDREFAKKYLEEFLESN